MENIVAAGAWLAAQPPMPLPALVAALRERYGISRADDLKATILAASKARHDRKAKR